MADDSSNLLADHVVSNCNSLLWIALIVADHANDLLAENTARSVEFVDCHVKASLELLTESGEAAGDRACHAERDIGMRCRRS